MPSSSSRLRKYLVDKDGNVIGAAEDPEPIDGKLERHYPDRDASWHFIDGMWRHQTGPLKCLGHEPHLPGGCGGCTGAKVMELGGG